MLYIFMQHIPSYGGDIMKVTHKINTDLQIREKIPRLAMVQCDCDSREIEITITSGGTTWLPGNIDNVFLRYRKNDGTGGCYDTLPDGTKAWSVNENKVTICIAPQMLTVPGMVEAQAVLVSGTQTVTTFLFQIAVEKDPSLGTVPSEYYINWSEWAEEKLNHFLEQAKQSGDFTGGLYVPAVDAEGNLSWTNNAGLANPSPVNIANLIAGKINWNILQGNLSGHINMNGHRIMGLPEPEADNDAATKGYTLSTVKSAAPRNLLDNSNFMNPVNQRGGTSYSGAGYCIDRWRMTDATSLMSIDQDGVTFVGNGGWNCSQQEIQVTADMRGKTYTAAIGTKEGEIYVFGNGVLPATATGDYHIIGERVTTAKGYELILYEAPNGNLLFQIRVPDGGADLESTSAQLKWAAIYEGSYTAETLPKYQPKGYVTELLECQRYFRRLSTNVVSGYITTGGKELIFAINHSMRINPTVSFNGTAFYLRTISGYSASANGAVPTSGTSAISSEGIKLTFKWNDSELGTNNTPAVLEIRGIGDTYIDLSADL